MNIIGPDALVFGVDDVAGCGQYLLDYGLEQVNGAGLGQRFEALDGTAIIIAHKGDTQLPASLGTASMLRKTIYGSPIGPRSAPSPRSWGATVKCAS
jgi:hypothetical protein